MGGVGGVNGAAANQRRVEFHSIRVAHVNAPANPFTAQTVLHMKGDCVGIFARALERSKLVSLIIS